MANRRVGARNQSNIDNEHDEESAYNMYRASSDITQKIH
jgi:hypothetical protein